MGEMREQTAKRNVDVGEFFYITNCLRFLNNTSYGRNAASCARLFDTLIDFIIHPISESTVYAENMPYAKDACLIQSSIQLLTFICGGGKDHIEM
jgi:hypothetical protein